MKRLRGAPILPRMARPKRPRDTNQLAKAIVDLATDEAPDRDRQKAEGQQKGGRKGGRVRAERLTSERRSEIAKKAAQSRWQKDRADV